jgi:hypothetical protein
MIASEMMLRSLAQSSHGSAQYVIANPIAVAVA